jgi:hypothetical protein
MLQVLSARRCSESSLLFAEAYTAKISAYGQPILARHGLGEQFCLVKSPFPPPVPMHGHRNYQVETSIEWHSLHHELAERAGQNFDFGVFEKPDQVAQCTFVIAIAENGIKANISVAASRTDFLLVERIGIKKRREAKAARMVRRYETGRGETGGTNRNS